MRYFITGTDTGVGKTVLSLCIMKYLYNKKLEPYYLKPFQTGCSHSKDTDSDAYFVYKHINGLEKTDPVNSMIYCYKNPLAPLYAARDENRLNEISIKKVIEYIEVKEKLHKNIIIEGAGGVLVPVTPEKLIIDYINELNCKVIITGRAGLGTINHTLLTIEALKKRHIEILAVVLIDNEETSNKAISENIEAIESYSDVKVIGVINNIKDFNSLPNSILNIFDSIFK